MKAMILAAGMGTRLKPLTDCMPKALVEIDGIPILERVILSLRNNGFNSIVVNVHHFASQIVDFIKSKNFSIEIQISDESTELLDTGGGIVKAIPLLFQNDNSPVLIHNVDILSNADLNGLMNTAGMSDSGCQLLVSDRESSRKLIFDPEMVLNGWHDLKNEKFRIIGSSQPYLQEFAFSGIYTITPEAALEMKRLNGIGKYSVMEFFLNSQRSQKVTGFLQKNLKLLDIGKPATLSQASRLLNEFN